MEYLARLQALQHLPLGHQTCPLNGLLQHLPLRHTIPSSELREPGAPRTRSSENPELREPGAPRTRSSENPELREPGTPRTRHSENPEASPRTRRPLREPGGLSEISGPLSVASHTLVMQIEISVYGVYVRHWACALKFVFWHMRMRTYSC